jgi:hypothetical protein
VEELFKVKVLRVNTMNVRGKLRRQRTHQAGKVAGLEEGHRHPEGRRQDRPDLRELPMPVKTFRPLTPSRRYSRSRRLRRSPRDRPEKSLVTIRKKTGGRNAYGRVTARASAAATSRRFAWWISSATSTGGADGGGDRIRSDPQSARLALLEYKDGEKRYIVAPKGLQVGAR